MEKPVEWDFWKHIGHFGKTGWEGQEVLCPWPDNRDSVSRDGNGEVRKEGTCCLETFWASASEAGNSSVSAASRDMEEEEALR